MFVYLAGPAAPAYLFYMFQYACNTFYQNCFYALPWNPCICLSERIPAVFRLKRYYFNTVGQIYAMFGAAMSVTAFLPFQCDTHPNGRRTVHEWHLDSKASLCCIAYAGAARHAQSTEGCNLRASGGSAIKKKRPSAYGQTKQNTRERGTTCFW